MKVKIIGRMIVLGRMLALAAAMVGTPLETIVGNHFLFGAVIGDALTRIWREEGRL